MTEAFEIDDFSENEELFEHYSFVAAPGQKPLRVDKFLGNLMERTSRNRLQVAARAGSIRVNDLPVKSNYRVKAGDRVALVLAFPPREIELLPENIPLDILYQDADLIVLNKTAGLVVHPGYGNYTGTLVNALMYLFDNLPVAAEKKRPGLVHRLDKNTSGVMVVAASDYAMTHLANQFFERTTDRNYVALVWGDVKEDKGTITGYLGRSVRDRKVMDVFTDPEKGKWAVTHYEVLERFGFVTLVRCKLETGRTHQIRVHFKSIGHPLFADPEYGGEKILKGTTRPKYTQFIANCMAIFSRQALHAKTLGFTHPETGERLFFETELPADFNTVLEKLRRYIAGSVDTTEEG
jgi:23S rRNA pseudouridine1911/1915/1917 synthase